MSTFPGAFVPVAPPADGLRLAFAGARRRRSTKAGASGAAGLLAVLLVLASAGGGGDRTLLQEPLPPATSGGGLVGVVGGSEPTAAASPPAASTPVTPVLTTAQRRAAATGIAGAGPRDASSGTPRTDSSSRVHAASDASVTGPMSRSYGWNYTNGDLICPARKQQQGERFCAAVSASSSTADGTTSITANICNVGTAQELLTYATARELDVYVRKAGDDVWRWSVGRSFADAPHGIDLPVGECVSWSTTWRQVDSRGAAVAAGNYAVVAEFDAQQLPAADRRATYTLTITRP